VSIQAKAIIYRRPEQSSILYCDNSPRTAGHHEIEFLDHNIIVNAYIYRVFGTSKSL
jgi:hypothetical protein